MAERRMFAKTIIDSDAFLDMPITAQLLYFHLSMRADDDGFINQPKSIMRMCGCKDDDIKILFSKKLVIPFESGIVVIKHWKVHNYIRKDTYTETKYKDEKSLLELDENNAYRESVTGSLRVRDGFVTGPSTQVRKGKERKGKDRLGKGVYSVGGAHPDGPSEKEESSDSEEEPSDYDELKTVGGDCGQGVLKLTDRQLNGLVEKLGVDGFNTYTKRLSDYIIKKNATVRNHYATVLKWYDEDNGTNFGGAK